MTITFVSDIVCEDGRTVKEHNLDLKHQIPLGTLVEVLPSDYPDEEDDPHTSITTGTRIFIVGHGRDCDGTPLYHLSSNKNAMRLLESIEAQMEAPEYAFADRIVHTLTMRSAKERARGAIHFNWGESAFKVVE